MELSREERYKLGLYYALEGRRKQYLKSLSAFGSAEEAFRGMKGRESDIDRHMEALWRLGIGVVMEDSPAYPALLKEIYDPPAMLFVRGTLRENIPLPLGVVGARKCSSYGRQMAERFGRALAGAGLTVISGMAYGIDSIAARAALETESEYPTVAVLGTGVDIPYPRENAGLYERILARGAVLSEYLPGTGARKENFPARNRIISGISRGVLVVEAGEKSGSSITVNFALDEGRDVFAIPGRVTDPMSAGCNAAIRGGYAKPVFAPEDILWEYGLEAPEKPKQEIAPQNLCFEQALILKLLQIEPRTFDELCEMTEISPPLLNSSLTAMELSGIIKQSSGRTYQL